MVNPDEDILQQLTQEEPSESPLTLLASNTTTASDAPSGSLNAYRASGASVQPAKDPTEVFKQLHPEAATRIQRFFELADERGLGLKPGSMNRDYGTQAKMYANRASNPYPVAPPGGSAHMGFATDFSGYKPEKLQAIRELAKEVGLVYGGNWSGKTFDPVHIQLGPGSDVTRYIQGHIDPKAGTVNWEGVRSTQLPEDFIARAIAAAQGQNVPVKEVKVEGAPNATGTVTAAAEPSVEEADAKVEVTKKRSKDIDLAKLIKMLDDSSHGGADYLSRSMQANAQQAQANRSRSLAQIAQFDQEQVNKMAEALKGGRTQSFKEGGEVEGEDTPNLDKLISDLMKQRTTEAEILDNGFKPRDYDPAKITQALSIMSGSKDPSTQLQLQYMLGKLGLNAGVLQSDKYRGYNAGVNIPLSDTSSVNLGGNYGRVMGAYGQESPASWGVRGSYVKRFAEGGPKLPDRPEYEITDNSDAVDMTPAGPWERTFQKVTGGRNLQNDLSNIKSRLPTGQDYGHALLEQHEATQGLNALSGQNIREGYANRDIPQMLLGTGQGVLGLINPALAPINAGFEVLSKTAGKFDPRAKVEAELLGLVGTEGAGVTQKLHNLELPKSSWDALLKKYQDSGATQAMTIGLPAAVAAAERPAEAVTRSLSPVGSYSHAAEMAEALPQAKGPSEQMIGMMKNAGVKPAELEHAGMITPEGDVHPDWAGRTVTRDELHKHLVDSMPKVEEKVLKPISDIKQSDMAIDNWLKENNYKRLDDAAEELDVDERTLRNRILEDENNFKNINTTQYDEYNLLGGENYREVLLKLPYEKKEQDKSGSLLYRNSMPKYKPPEFQSTHWNEPNVLAHVRMSDRTGPNGEKLLHVEELQSDWGQKGREQGFAKKYHPDELEFIDPKNITDERRRNQFWNFKTPEGAFSVPKNDRWSTAEDAKNHLLNTKLKSGVPTAPYVTSTQGWTDLALKRVLKEAAEGGYDGIVFTPGKEQAKRYPKMEEKAAQGLQKFYDNIVTKRVQELAKQHDKDAKLGHMEIPDSAPMKGASVDEILDWHPETKHLSDSQKAKYWASLERDEREQLFEKYFEETGARKNVTGFHLPVTDKMREHILKGQKAYMRGGRVGYADGGLVADNADGTGRQQYDAYGNMSDSQGGPVHAVQYDPDRINMMAQQLHEGTYG